MPTVPVEVCQLLLRDLQFVWRSWNRKESFSLWKMRYMPGWRSRVDIPLWYLWHLYAFNILRQPSVHQGEVQVGLSYLSFRHAGFYDPPSATKMRSQPPLNLPERVHENEHCLPTLQEIYGRHDWVWIDVWLANSSDAYARRVQRQIYAYLVQWLS